MEYAYHTANDGAKLAFQTSLPLLPPPPAGPGPVPDPKYKKCILLIHGFSGSSHYFKRNFAALSADHWVVAPDLRGHGNSARTTGGYHVARLAADIKDLVAHLRSSSSIVAVGCSIGAAVLWTYAELFGDAEFAGFVFVDQAPLQDRSFGWGADKAHRGCFDEVTLRAAQRAWMLDTPAAHLGLVGECLGYRFEPLPGDGVSEAQRREDEEFFVGESRRCDPSWLARLMADHTHYDHREAIEECIRVPVLVMAGRRTGCFTLDGIEETVRRVEAGHGGGKGPARMSVFESGHWLFYEEPERFNREVVDFVAECVKS